MVIYNVVKAVVGGIKNQGHCLLNKLKILRDQQAPTHALLLVLEARHKQDTTVLGPSRRFNMCIITTWFHTYLHSILPSALALIVVQAQPPSELANLSQLLSTPCSPALRTCEHTDGDVYHSYFRYERCRHAFTKVQVYCTDKACTSCTSV